LVYKGKGCSVCNHTGYKGRVGLYEVMPITPEIRSMILQGKSSDAIREKAIEQGMQTLKDDGIDKILQGVTTVEELMRETGAL
jgi:type IV pilus assembly protein PilB